MSERGLPPQRSDDGEVAYVNENEKTYHKSLGCSAGGVRTTLAEAVQDDEVTPCGICYRNRIVSTDSAGEVRSTHKTRSD